MLFSYTRRTVSRTVNCKQKILTYGSRQHTGAPLAARDGLLKMNTAETASWVELHQQVDGCVHDRGRPLSTLSVFSNQP